MDLLKLQTFLHVAELGSITKTAALLDTTQSVISRQVNALEMEFGGRLFHRTGRGVRLTELGERIEPRVRNVLIEIERIGTEGKTLAGIPSGEVKVGILTSLAPYLSKSIFGEIRRSYPEIRLHLVDGFSGQLEEQLADGKLDMALLFDYEGLPPGDSESIAQLDSYLIGPKGDPLTRSATVEFSHLRMLPLILPTYPNGLRVALDDAARRSGFKLSVAIQASSIPIQLAIVAEPAGSIYAISSYYAVVDAVNQGVLQAARIKSPGIDRTLVLKLSSRRPPSLASRETAKLLSRISRTLVDNAPA